MQGSKIVVQLWHVGRISHPDLLDGDIPVAPSAIQPAGEVVYCVQNVLSLHLVLYRMKKSKKSSHNINMRLS